MKPIACFLLVLVGLAAGEFGEKGYSTKYNIKTYGNPFGPMYRGYLSGFGGYGYGGAIGDAHFIDGINGGYNGYTGYGGHGLLHGYGAGLLSGYGSYPVIGGYYNGFNGLNGYKGYGLLSGFNRFPFLDGYDNIFYGVGGYTLHPGVVLDGYELTGGYGYGKLGMVVKVNKNIRK